MILPRTALTAAALLIVVGPMAVLGQRRGEPEVEPQVEIVQTSGCVDRRDGDPASWWLTRATEPEVSRRGVFNETQVEEAREITAGSREFQLVGVADFLDAESLLAWGERAKFTTREQVNATKELREGRTVLVKGLLIEAEPSPRINLLAVVGLADDCG